MPPPPRGEPRGPFALYILLIAFFRNRRRTVGRREWAAVALDVFGGVCQSVEGGRFPSSVGVAPCSLVLVWF